MSYLSERSPSQMIGIVVAAIVAGLVVRFFWYGGVEEYFNPAKRMENQIVDALEARPGDLAVLRAMETYFPLQYDEMLENMAGAAMDDASPEQVMEIGSMELAKFMQGHRNDFKKAPDAALSAVLAKETELLEAFIEGDPVGCSDYMFGTLQPADPLPENIDRLIGETEAARVGAMAAGRADQQNRFPSTPTDQEKLVDAMRAAGASDAQLALLFGEGDASALTSREQCDSALRLMRGIAAQEPGRRAVLTGEYLVR